MADPYAELEKQVQTAEVFYATERDIAKGYATHPYTAEYVKRLEAIAEAAHKFWGVSETKTKEQSACEHALYDALFAVNFMDDEQS